MNKIKEEEYMNTTQNSKQLLKNSKFFEIGFYKKQNPHLKNTNFTDDEIIEYYLKHNKDEQFPTSKYFDVKWYMKHNPNVKKIDVDPLIHFLKIGRDEQRLYRYTTVNFKALNLPDELNLYKMYKTIYHSELFDIDYYLSNNGEFDLEGYDPIIHYILIGAKCGYNPSRKFNTNKYLENQNHDKIITNPLYHYITYRKDILDKSFNEIYTKQFNKHNHLLTPTTKDILAHLKRKISIIIPIYNAYEETCECICSVLLNTHLDYELILINDASSDKRIKTLLDKLEDIENVKVIHNLENQGFVKNVNTGMKIADNNDVVLLNSDTIVTPRWLTKLVTAAYSDPTVATVTPLSNSSDISAKNLGINKDQLALNKKAYQLSKTDYDSYFESPTGNGYCLFIKRGALNKLGLFDPIFKRGYGEETDFTSKAREEGWKNLRILDTFIYHRSHASFKEETNQLKEENKKINMERHPDVFKLWDEFAKDPKLNKILKKAESLQSSDISERILYVTQQDKEGNPEVTPEFYEIAQKYDTHILTLEEDEISLFIYDGIFEFKKIYSKKLVDKTDDEIKTFYFNFITSLRYDLFYIRQVNHYISCLYVKMAEFVKFATLLEIPVVYEGNYYYNNLIDTIHEKLNPLQTLDDIIDDQKNRFSFKDKKVVIYTAITGNYDTLQTPSVIDDEFDYVCFTDNPDIKSDFWDVRLIEDDDELDSIRKARKYKILPHKYLSEYDYSIWVDGCFDIIADIRKYVQKYSKNHKLLAITHDVRDCIYDEAIACINADHDLVETINTQIEKYEQENFPKHNGLIASGILFRDHHDPDVIKLMNDWFNEVKNHSRRDQLSFNYVCWKNNFQYDMSDIYYFRNQYFFRADHSDHVDRIHQIKYSKTTKDEILENLQKSTTIAIPIYNAYEDTLKCIKSVIKHTKIPYELLLIDDASSDKRINPMLEEFSSKYDNIHLITNSKNQGFVKNVNKAFKYSENDILLLNSDTIVTPGWLSKIKTTAYTDASIGTVTPLSNNSGAFSVPILNKVNLIDDNIGLNKTANIIEKLNSKTINTPTANGFCMYIKRPVIDEVGLFDVGFKRGYGGENDFSMRLIDKGWKNVIDTTTYIYHNESASFGSEKQKLVEENRKYLAIKHPEYKKLLTKFINDSDYEQVRSNIADVLNDEHIIKNTKERLMYVTDDEDDLINEILNFTQHVSSEYNIYLLTASKETLKIYKFNPNTNDDDSNISIDRNLTQIMQWNIDTTSDEDLYDSEFELIYFNLLKQLNIDKIHIQDMNNHTFDLPKVAHIMGIDVILSLNNYYINQTYNIDNDTINITENTDTWQNNVSQMLKNCSKIITKSKTLNESYKNTYPELKDKLFNIIDEKQEIQTIKDIKDDKNRQNLIPDNKQVYQNKPITKKQIQKTTPNPNLQIADNYIQAYNDDGKKNILLIEPMINNEITLMSSQLMSMILDDYNFYILISDDDNLILYTYDELHPDLIEDKSNLKFMENFKLLGKWNINNDGQLKDIYNEILSEYKIDTTHIIQLKDHLLTLNDIIDVKDNNVIISIYDEYYLNLDYELYDVFKNVSRIIFNTDEIHDKYMDIYGEFKDKTWIFKQERLLQAPSKLRSDINLKHDRPRILIWDDIIENKDYEFIRELKSYDVDDTFDFYFIGKISDEYNMEELGFVYETNKYDEITLVEKINPHFIGMYTKEVQPTLHSLYRAWDLGIPVFRIYNGRVANKIKSKGGGLILDEDPKAAYDRMQQIFMKNVGLYELTRKEILDIDFSPINKDNIMWEVKSKYLTFYENNILMVIHKGSGGTYNTSFDIMQYAGCKYNFYFLINDVNYVYLLKFNYDRDFNDYTFTREDFKDYFDLIEKWHLSTSFSFTPENLDEYEKLYEYVIKKYNINLIHIQHLIFSHRIPQVAHNLGLKIILSLHDFYYICPAYNLVDNNLNFCGGKCTPTENICEDQCILGKSEIEYPILRIFNDSWKKQNREMFKYCDHIIAPSKSTRDIYVDNYPELQDRIDVIGHGYDYITDEKIDLPELRDDKPIRILIPGNLSIVKGINYILKLKSYDKDNRLELHFMGNAPEDIDLSEIGVVHGIYERFEFRSLVEEINPHFIGIFSICPETFCYTLSESWYYGVPVICMNIGALKERVDENGGGLIIPEDPKESYDTILEFCQDNDKYNKLKGEVLDIDIKDRKTMVSEYISIYDEQLNDE